MMSESLDKQKIEKMYQTLRKAEWQNDRTGEYDDKKMVDRIERYLVKRRKKVNNCEIQADNICEFYEIQRRKYNQIFNR